MTHLVKILQKYGPLPSDDFASRLVTHKIAQSAASARKQIERAVAAGEVLSTAPVRFDKRFLYYLEKHKGKIYASAIKKLLSDKPPLCRVYFAMLDNKGYITAGQIGKYSCAVHDKADYTTGKRKKLTAIINELLKIELIETVAGCPGIYKIGKGFGTARIKLAMFTKLLQFEQTLICELIPWIQNTYLIGKESYNLRESETTTVNFNTTCWDFVAPTYIGPCTTSLAVNTKKRMIKAFVVLDIVSFRQYSENDADSLIERLKAVTLNWKTLGVFPVALSVNYTPKALSTLRKHGIVPLTYKEIWGRNVERLFKLYMNIFSGNQYTDIDVIKSALEISEQNTEKDGIFGCIKGDLFEVMTALAYRSQGYDTSIQKKIASSLGEAYEIDVVAMKNDNECILIECKGRNISPEEHDIEIKRHFDDRCQIASDPYGWDVTNRYPKVEAIYFTTSVKEAIPPEYVKERISYGIKCRILARDEVIDVLKASDNQLAELVKQYYIRPPLSKISSFNK